MTNSTEMNNIIEERYQFCISLYLIKKETDKRNKEKREQGEKNLVYIDIFALPSHIKKLFGPFLKTPKYTELTESNNSYFPCLVPWCQFRNPIYKDICSTCFKKSENARRRFRENTASAAKCVLKFSEDFLKHPIECPTLK